MKRTVLKALSLTFALLLVTLAVVSCGGNEGGDGYVFRVDSLTLRIGVSADVVRTQLGEPLNKNVTAACGGIPGEDVVYTFEGYRIKTTPGKNGDVICMIELTDDSVSTPEGLTIGSTKDKVVSTMGKGETVGENLIYAKGNMKLQFLIRDGFVTNIQYLAK